MKRCCRCKEEKPISDFSKNRSSKDGLQPTCRSCCKENMASWYTRNKDKVKKNVKEWRARFPDKIRKIRREYVKNNPDKIKELNRKWYKDHPEKTRAKNRKYKSRKRGNGGVITVLQEKELYKFYNFTCLCCERREPEVKMTLDHVLPISKGGKNVIENAQPLCKSCNSRKNNRHIDYRKKLL